MRFDLRNLSIKPERQAISRTRTSLPPLRVSERNVAARRATAISVNVICANMKTADSALISTSQMREDVPRAPSLPPPALPSPKVFVLGH
ncbi:hypothetical protein EVAR_51802_1 [Eumeta japonica]|uniref:Uncharacterized protein n=1 Tax=Eumeta variegata TaxID=151549 RepID=A0A4C2A745_EUMVA|nr:hypothetical protein EVAR_51802_1 [Eumeta japonica]